MLVVEKMVTRMWGRAPDVRMVSLPRRRRGQCMLLENLVGMIFYKHFRVVVGQRLECVMSLGQL